MSDSFDDRMTVGEVESRISRQIEKFADIPEFGSCDDFMKEQRPRNIARVENLFTLNQNDICGREVVRKLGILYFLV